MHKYDLLPSPASNRLRRLQSASDYKQVFNGDAPYLLYEGHPTNLPPAMRRHREASKTSPEKVVAIFRETVLPCLSPAHHHHYHHHHHRSLSGGAVTAAAAAAAALLSGGGGGGGGSFRGYVCGHVCLQTFSFVIARSRLFCGAWQQEERERACVMRVCVVPMLRCCRCRCQMAHHVWV